MALTELSSLEDWHKYYIRNAVADDGIQWHLEETLTSDETERIADSIATFQLGEYSEGRGLMKYAAAYAKNFGDDRLTKITRLFIGEEQNHALLLKRFMGLHGIKTINKNWTDEVFRKLRKNVGYEWSITVLIVAEIIALVYYKALKECTGSQVLKAICDKILLDETFHVRYESELIRGIRDSNPRWLKYTAIFLHRFLFSGTLIVVYCCHRRVLKYGGYNFVNFWSSSFTEFDKCFRPTELVAVTSVLD